MTKPEKVLLVRLLKRLSENADGEIFLEEFLPNIEDRKKIYLDMLEHGDRHPGDADSKFDEIDESLVLDFLSDRLAEEVGC